jgi:hypothetical protein
MDEKSEENMRDDDQRLDIYIERENKGNRNRSGEKDVQWMMIERVRSYEKSIYPP